jgi:FixJ family two-component response regulator
VFVVDDDESFLASVARLLRASGLLVKAFSSAADFLGQRPPAAPGCVVADLQMPGMSGIELQEALAKSDNPLPVVFLTGQGDIPTSVKAMRHGAEDFLTKRAPKKELMSAVQRALERDARDREERERRRELLEKIAEKGNPGEAGDDWANLAGCQNASAAFSWPC